MYHCGHVVEARASILRCLSGTVVTEVDIRRICTYIYIYIYILHYITLYYIILHYITLYYIILYYIILYIHIKIE